VAFTQRDGSIVDLLTVTEAARRRLARTDWALVQQNPRDGLRMGVSAGGNVGERLMGVGARHYGQIRGQAVNWLEQVEIPVDRVDDLPGEFSGGMQQRLQIARAIAYQPKILLMDEPFGSLDALTRFELEDGLLALWPASPKTIIFVTHDIDEAIYLSDRVIVVSSRPARVQAEFSVELPRPRHQIETRSLPGFAALRGDILRLIGTVA
jgi:putative phosphonate transport system ATP-binding protein